MDVNSSDFRDSLLELIDTSPEPGEHPSADQWLAYHRGELPAHEEARLQEHLVRCRDCFDLAEAAAAFAQPDEETGTGQEVETAALWRLLRPRLEPPRQNVREIAAGPRQRRSWGARVPYALAASFFVALVGLTALNLQQDGELKALRAPRANVPTLEIAAGERTLPLAGQELSMPAGSRRLVFHPGEDLPAYRLVIREAATGRELSSHELLPDRDLAFDLYLPEGLPPGRYRLELLDGVGKVRETHLLRVTGD